MASHGEHMRRAREHLHRGLKAIVHDPAETREHGKRAAAAVESRREQARLRAAQAAREANTQDGSVPADH